MEVTKKYLKMHFENKRQNCDFQCVYIEIGIVKKKVKKEYFEWMIFFIHICFLHDEEILYIHVDIGLFCFMGGIKLTETKQLFTVPLTFITVT